MARRKGPIATVIYPDADEMTHSVDAPICGDDTCICAGLEYAQLVADVSNHKPGALRKMQHNVLVEKNYEGAGLAPLNGNEGFSLLKRPIPINRGRNPRA